MTENKHVAMKPCPNPWCESHDIEGGEPNQADIWELSDTIVPRFAVHCPYCTMQGPGASSEAEAVTAWNTRALEASQAGDRDAVTRLRGALNQIKMAVGFIRCYDPEKTVDEGLANIIGIAIKALDTSSRVEAAQPQEAVDGENEKMIAEIIQNNVGGAMMLLPEQSRVAAQKIVAALTPPIQAAESGLREVPTREEIARELFQKTMLSQRGANTAADVLLAILAKAGKQGEGDREG